MTSAEFKRILVPLDLSDTSPSILSYALSLAKRANASVDVLFVWELPRFVTPDLAMPSVAWTLSDLQGTATKEANAELSSLVKSADTTGLQVRTAVVVGTPATSILHHAERENTDLIIMGTHGRTGLQRLLLGSVAQRVVASAPCPVLTLHAYPHEGRKGSSATGR